MPRYTINFEEDHKHKMQVDIEANDEQEAQQKVYNLDYGDSIPINVEDILLGRIVFDASGNIVQR